MDSVARAVSLPFDFGALYAAIFNAMHEESRGGSHEFGEASLLSFGRSLELLMNHDPYPGDETLGELVKLELLYWCLRASLDRVQQVSAAQKEVRKVRSRVAAALTKLRGLPQDSGRDKSDGKAASAKNKAKSGKNHAEGDTVGYDGAGDLAYSRTFMPSQASPSGPLVVGKFVLGYAFEVEAQETLLTCLTNIDALLNSLNGVQVVARPGQPRKYSLKFLILRCALIYESHHPGKPTAGVTTTKETDPDYESENAYRGPFVDFVRAVLKATDRTALSAEKSGLGKTIQEALRLRKRRPEIAKVVNELNGQSSAAELFGFMELCEGARS